MTQARGIATLVSLAILVAPAFLPFADARVWPLSELDGPLDGACDRASTACATSNSTLDAACSQSRGGCEALNATGADPTGAACAAADDACAVANAGNDQKVNAVCDRFAGAQCATANETTGDPTGAACVASPGACAVLDADNDEKQNAVCDRFAQTHCETLNETTDDPTAPACVAAEDACAVLLAPSGETFNAFCDRFASDACATANETTDDPTGPACVAAAGVCAVIEADDDEKQNAFCDRFARTQCATANETQDDPTGPACAAASQACAIVNAPPGEQRNAACDQLSRDGCQKYNSTSQNPIGTACGATGHGRLCDGANATAADRNPAHVAEAACSDGHSAQCEQANETVPTIIATADETVATAKRSLPGAVNESEALVIVAPTPNAWTSTPLALEFTTKLPQAEDSPFSFLVQVAPAGTSDWESLADVICVGDASPGGRTCSADIPHGLNGDYALRVAAASEETCNLNNCAWVNGIVHFDTEAPVTALGSLPSTAFTNQISVPFTVEDQDAGALVALHYETAGVEHVSAATPSGGAFTFLAPGDGAYAFWTVGTDAAGNVEDATGKARSTVTFVHTLSVSMPDTFVTDGQHAIVQATVTQNGASVPADAIVTATYGGNDYPLAHQGGSLWTADLGALSIAAASNEIVHVVAALDDAAGTFDGTLVLSPHRLVHVAVDAPDYVQSASSYPISLSAVFADTGAPADRLHFVVKDGSGATLTDGYATSTGNLRLWLPSPGAPASLAITVSAAEAGQGPSATPVTAASTSLDAVWTDLAGELTAKQHATGWADSGLPFGLTYCVEYAHDGSPLANGFVSVTETASEEVFQGTTGEDGCVVVDVTENDGEYGFTANAAATPDVGDMLYNDIPGAVDLVFTKVSLDLSTAIPAGHYVNLEDVAGFSLCAEYTYLAGAAAEGAVVDLVDQDGATLETVTLGADGCADAPHVFHDVYDGSVGLVLVSTPQMVTLQVGPTPLDGIVATEVVVGGISATDTFADWGQTVTYTLPLTWAHDGAALAQADVTLDGGACSAVSGGAVTCQVARSGNEQTTFSPTLSTNEGVTRIRDAINVETPETVWTAVEASVTVSDALVEVGDAPTVTYVALYTYDNTPAASFTVRFTSACGLDEVVEGANGVARLDVASATPCQSPIAARLVTTDEGIATQTDLALATPNVVWTRISLSPAVDDEVATLGQSVLVSGAAIYGVTGGNVPSGDLLVTDGAGVQLASIPIVDGAFSGAVSKSNDYHGALHFEVVNGFEDVNAIDPVTVAAAWTHVTLTVVADKTLASVATPIQLNGTASYALSLGNVVTGLVEIVDEDGIVVATANVADGAWSVAVALAGAYDGRLTVRIVESDQQVEGFDVETPNLVWTSIVLTLTAPGDLFVNAGDVMAYDVAAAYAYDLSIPVSDADLTAYTDNGVTVLGTCHVVGGACQLDLRSLVSYAGAATVVVTGEGNGVLAQSAPVVTAPLVWTRLIVQATAPALPANVGNSADVGVAVTYEHNGAPVQDALVTVSGLSPGSQYGYSAADGSVVIHAYETQAGTKTLTVSAQDDAQGIHVMEAPGSVSARWTAIGFNGYTYSVTPASVDANGNPTFPVGTRVSVCTVATPSDDAATPLAGARVLLRGAVRTADASGSACLTVVGPSAPGNVKFTAHGVSATIGGASITASSDRSVTIYFAS